MFSKIVIASCSFLLAGLTSAMGQVLYSENFSGISVMNSGGAGSSQFLYNDVPSSFVTINNGGYTAASVNGNNNPFSETGMGPKAWLAYRPANPAYNDTFAVATSYLNPAGISDMWLITPVISGIDASTVLSWEAMAADNNFPDGYEVYFTTNVSTTPTALDFPAANRLFSIAQEASTWKQHGLSLGAYAGQSIRLAFRNNSTDDYQIWIDDIVVKKTTIANDIAVSNLSFYKYVPVLSNTLFLADVQNLGYSPITNVTMNYKVGTSPVVTQVIPFTTILNYLEKTSIAFTIPYTSQAPGYYPVKVWISTMNGQADQVNTNDTVSGGLTVVTQVPAKKVLLEQYTSAYDGWSPDGYTKAQAINAADTSVLSAYIHVNDMMEKAAGQQLFNDFATDLATATIDHADVKGTGVLSLERSDWTLYTAERKAVVVPATVALTNVSYNSGTRDIQATVQANFTGEVHGDYRLNLYVLENNVFGPYADLTNNGWNQVSFLYNIVPSPYYQIGTPLTSDSWLLLHMDYRHMMVADTLLGGAYGDAGVIPSSGGTQGQSFSKTYNYTLPLPTGTEFRYNPDNIYLLGVVSEYNASLQQRAILNISRLKLNSNGEMVGIEEQHKNTLSTRLYPNPASTSTTLLLQAHRSGTATLQISNLLGQLVYVETHPVSVGENTLLVDTRNLPDGMYNVLIATEEGRSVQHLQVVR